MIAVAILVSVLAAADGLPVEVQGTSLCPSSAEVSALLPEMLPITNTPRPDIAWLEAEGLDLLISLRNRDGQELFQRRITSHSGCAELATVAAVVISTWKLESDPALSLMQPGVPPPQPPATAASAIEAPPDVPAPAALPRTPIVFDVAVAAGTTASSAGFVANGRIEASARRRRFGLRLGFSAETAHDSSIASGTATWRRLAVGFGPMCVLVDRAVRLELDAQLFAGITTVSGRGYDTDQQKTDFSPGLSSALRLGLGSGRVRPWIEIGGQLWLAPQSVLIERNSRSVARLDLPRLEARASIGLSFSLFP